jgi:hypothetical protein
MNGTARIRFLTEDGERKVWRAKRSDQVNKTLGSVSEFRDKGYSVIFTRTGGALVKGEDGKLAEGVINKAKSITKFRRERGVYVMDMYVPRVEAGGVAGGKATGGRTGKVDRRSGGPDPDRMEVDALAEEEWQAYVSRCRRNKRGQTIIPIQSNGPSGFQRQGE